MPVMGRQAADACTRSPTKVAPRRPVLRHEHRSSGTATASCIPVHKTQVFVYHEGDYFRTRMTHSIEVAQIARSMARALWLNDDLAEAVSLAHDLGHTPFGHAGEDALRRAMQPHGGFDHNEQTVRVVTGL